MADFDFKKAFKLEGKSLLVKANLVKVYLPNEFIEKGITEVSGQIINTFGIFNIGIQLEPGSKFIQKTFNCPYIVNMKPSRILSERNEDKILINVLEFVQDDQFIMSVDLESTWKIGEKFLSMLFSGYLPKTIKYDEIMPLWEEVDRLSNLDLKVTDADKEITIAELARNPDNLKQLFRHVINKHPEKADKLMYKMVRLTLLGKLNNTFSAVSGGDPKQGITMSINRERYNEPQIISPVEEAIK